MSGRCQDHALVAAPPALTADELGASCLCSPLRSRIADANRARVEDKGRFRRDNGNFLLFLAGRRVNLLLLRLLLDHQLSVRSFVLGPDLADTR